MRTFLIAAAFALLIVDSIDHEIGEQLLNLAVNAVWISAVLHGITAFPLAGCYGAYMSGRNEDAEMAEVPPMRPEIPLD